MSDNVPITPGVGDIIAADEVIDPVLGTVKVQYVKLMSGEDGGTDKAIITEGGLKVDASNVTLDVSATPSFPLPTGASTEATLALIKAKTDNLDALLSTRNVEATQLLVKGNLDDIKTALSTLNSKDFATQTTLALIKAKTDNLDVLLSSRNLEATQILVKTNLDDIKTALATLNANDFATEATLALIRAGYGVNGAAVPLSSVLLGGKDSGGLLKPLETILVDGKERLRVYDVSRDYVFCDRQQLFTLSIDVNAASAGVNNPLILLRNPAGSGKRLILDHIEFGMAAKATQATLRFYKNPTVTTTGTLQTIQNLWVGTAPLASVMASYSAPTVSAAGQQIGVAATGKDTPTTAWDKQFGLIVNPGFDLLVTADPDANNRVVSITLTWGEEA